MAGHTIEISASLWKEMVAIAERRSRKPQTLVREALKDYLQRLADEALLEETIAAARRSGVTIREAEAAIKADRLERRRKQGA